MSNNGTWSISQLKSEGHINMGRAYWTCVLGGLVLAMAAGATGTGTTVSAIMKFITTTTMKVTGDPTGVFFHIFIFLAAIAAVFSIAGYAIGIFLMNPLAIGARRFFIVNRVQEAPVSEFGVAFRENYLNTVKTEFLRELYIFLWSLLLLVPGIIKGYEYRMVPYILAENPSIDSREAFRLSRSMMEGEKWNAFVLDLSFIGWHILSGFTFGLLDLFYTRPYQESTNVELYETLKTRMFNKTNSNAAGTADNAGNNTGAAGTDNGSAAGADNNASATSASNNTGATSADNNASATGADNNADEAQEKAADNADAGNNADAVPDSESAAAENKPNA